MDMRDVEDSADRLIVEMDNRPHFTNNRGALQGGLVATLIDCAAGRFAANFIRADQQVTTADMHINFLAPIMTGPAQAEATIVRAGKGLVGRAVYGTKAGAD